ncbi:MAG: alanine racemase [Patescibacteria group bacterium]|nr:alanine racemase [Patescibacteria group bacterium]
MVKRLIRYLRALQFHYTPLVEITISKGRMLHNLHTFQKINSEVKIAPVLKSNAYGHDLKIIAKIIDRENIPFIVVDSYHEAMILRNERIQSSILIIGYTAIENIIYNKLPNTTFVITGFEQLQEIVALVTKPTHFHIKIDTGMHRQGIISNQISEAHELINTNKNIIIDGVCSHFADADGKDLDFTKIQINEWNKLVKQVIQEFPMIKYRHISATSGALYINEIDANVLRLGIGLYGVDPNGKLDLKPVLEMKSIISGTKIIEKDQKIGYNCTYEAKEKMKIAIIPAGYYEGIDRRLSNKGFLKIDNIFCPIVGNISMNITAIDITNVPNAKFKTPVTIISSNPGDKNSIENIARINSAIPYDIMAHIPQQLRRKVTT